MKNNVVNPKKQHIWGVNFVLLMLYVIERNKKLNNCV